VLDDQLETGFKAKPLLLDMQQQGTKVDESGQRRETVPAFPSPHTQVFQEGARVGQE
jgi:hypothetical protein